MQSLSNITIHDMARLYSVSPISETFSDADDSLSDSIMTNDNHALYSYLPERRYLILSQRTVSQ